MEPIGPRSAKTINRLLRYSDVFIEVRFNEGRIDVDSVASYRKTNGDNQSEKFETNFEKLTQKAIFKLRDSQFFPQVMCEIAGETNAWTVK